MGIADIVANTQPKSAVRGDENRVQSRKLRMNWKQLSPQSVLPYSASPLGSVTSINATTTLQLSRHSDVLRQSLVLETV